MAQGNFELVFYGQLAQGVSLQQVKTNVAQLFKANSEQVERMFTGQRVVIRNKLDAETAQKYIAAMKKRGAICQLERMGQPGVKIEPEHTEPAPAAASHANVTTAPAETPATKPVDKTVHRDMNASGLPVAGPQTDAILSATHFELDPVGIRLSEAHEVTAQVFPHLDELSLAPVGSDLVDKQEQPPITEPDISYLSLKPEDS